MFVSHFPRDKFPSRKNDPVTRSYTEIKDVDDPYLRATVRELNDDVGVESSAEGENGVVTEDVSWMEGAFLFFFAYVMLRCVPFRL